ncbi:MAG: dockerin type I domain-containing protein [Planctomycetota bacterium]
MPNHRRLSLTASLLAVGCAWGPVSWADDFEWIGESPFAPTAFGADGNWVNLTQPGSPDTDGFPGFNDTAIFTIDARVDNGGAKNFVIEPQATLTIGPGTMFVADGVVTNDGVIRTGAEPSYDGLGVIGSATLTGSGELVMSGGNAGIRNNGVTQLTHEGGHTIRGHGTIDVGFVNHGTLFADSAAGSISVVDSTLTTFTLDTPTGVMAVRLDGPGFADSGAFVFNTNAIDLGGVLKLVAGENLDVQVGDVYTFFSSTGVSGSLGDTVFAAVDLSEAGPYSFDVIYTDNTVSVLVTGVLLPGDANGDGVVDLLDFDILAQNFGAPGNGLGIPNGVADGDFNGDGAVDLLDFDTLAQNFGSSSPASVPGAIPGAVPEPASLATLGLGGLWAARRRRS